MCENYDLKQQNKTFVDELQLHESQLAVIKLEKQIRLQEADMRVSALVKELTNSKALLQSTIAELEVSRGENLCLVEQNKTLSEEKEYLRAEVSRLSACEVVSVDLLNLQNKWAVSVAEIDSVLGQIHGLRRDSDELSLCRNALEATVTELDSVQKALESLQDFSDKSCSALAARESELQELRSKYMKLKTTVREQEDEIQCLELDRMETTKLLEGCLVEAQGLQEEKEALQGTVDELQFYRDEVFRLRTDREKLETPLLELDLLSNENSILKGQLEASRHEVKNLRAEQEVTWLATCQELQKQSKTVAVQK